MANERIKVYRTIGQFFDELTRLKRGETISYTGSLKVIYESVGEPENLAFHFESQGKSRIELNFLEEIDKLRSTRYWARLKNPNLEGSDAWSSVHLPVVANSWRAYFDKHNPNETKVRGNIGCSEFVIDLIPSLARNK